MGSSSGRSRRLLCPHFGPVVPRRGPRLCSRVPLGEFGRLDDDLEIGTGLYFIVMAMISSAIGGYLAGRLRTKWTGVHTKEVYFRDTAHGFLAWALASVLGAILLASPATSLLGGAASGTPQAVANSTQSSGPMDGYVDTLLRSDTPAAQNSDEPRQLAW